MCVRERESLLMNGEDGHTERVDWPGMEKVELKLNMCSNTNFDPNAVAVVRLRWSMLVLYDLLRFGTRWFVFYDIENYCAQSSRNLHTGPSYASLDPIKWRRGKDEERQKKNKTQQGKSDFITPRADDYGKWYLDVITAAEMVDSSPVKGCMVVRPWGMDIWDELKSELDRRIKSTGASNVYFPLFIPVGFLSKEAEHVEGFAKECAVVTHHRLCKNSIGDGLIADPEAKLEEPLVVRPTSETVIWDTFQKWIDSHRDLPLKINQWANVVRWELRTRPFLRSSEFLWQEGHTAHSTSEEAVLTAREMLDMYASTVADMLALPVVKGIKSPMERFSGAEDTYTIEALMQNGWALQSGTSHFLGQNFARAFKVKFQNTQGERELVWATSWGVSSRLIGALVMTHADDSGLRLPPAVAPVQVVIVPILGGDNEKNTKTMSKARELLCKLKSCQVRTRLDERSYLRSGAKFFEWERKGVPLRIEIGPREIESEIVLLKRRTGGEDKQPIPLNSNFVDAVQSQLSMVHKELWDAARDNLAARTFPCSTYDEMKVCVCVWMNCLKVKEHLWF